MKSNFFKSSKFLFIISFIFFLLLGINFTYLKYTNKRIKQISYDLKYNVNEVVEKKNAALKKEVDVLANLQKLSASFSTKFLENLVSKLRVYDSYDQNGKLVEMVQRGNILNDYVVPEIALEKADILVGYGVHEAH
jgi:hypothetical protein